MFQFIWKHALEYSFYVLQIFIAILAFHWMGSGYKRFDIHQSITQKVYSMISVRMASLLIISILIIDSATSSVRLIFLPVTVEIPPYKEKKTHKKKTLWSDHNQAKSCSTQWGKCYVVNVPITISLSFFYIFVYGQHF